MLNTTGDQIVVSPRGGTLSKAQDDFEFLNTLLSSNQLLDDNCMDNAIPFACHYLFPPCDTSGELYMPSRQECIRISTDVCQGAWQLAQELPAVALRLPDCDTLPSDGLSTSECVGMLL